MKPITHIKGLKKAFKIRWCAAFSKADNNKNQQIHRWILLYRKSKIRNARFWNAADVSITAAPGGKNVKKSLLVFTASSALVQRSSFLFIGNDFLRLKIKLIRAIVVGIIPQMIVPSPWNSCNCHWRTWTFPFSLFLPNSSFIFVHIFYAFCFLRVKVIWAVGTPTGQACKLNNIKSNRFSSSHVRHSEMCNAPAPKRKVAWKHNSAEPE